MKPLVSSLALHKETMSTLDIKTRVTDLFENASLDINNVMGLSTYKAIVYEFIASFSLKLVE